MFIQTLGLENVRIIQQARLSLVSGINVIFGQNGSGKTSILEAVHLLSRARSFRTPRVQELVRHGTEELQVVASISEANEKHYDVGFSRYRNQSRLRYKQQDVKSLADQAMRLPLIVQTTNSHELLIGSPKIRRKWFDWMLFHVKPAYIEQWKKYHQVLRHRNHVLRMNQSNQAELKTWEKQLVEHGYFLQNQLREMVDCLNPQLQFHAQRLFNMDAEIRYRNVVENEAEYLLLLEKKRQTDQQKGYTSEGPHAADLQLYVEGMKAAKTLSRGQSKLLISALLMAQLSVLSEQTGQQPIVLLDDLAAEFDKYSCEKIILTLKDSKAQCLVTTTEHEMFNNDIDSLFHVKRGMVEQL